jgi:hypothetical protein
MGVSNVDLLPDAGLKLQRRWSGRLVPEVAALEPETQKVAR